MLGNVSEWVSDNPGGGDRIIKGGASGLIARLGPRQDSGKRPDRVRRGFRCIWNGGK